MPSPPALTIASVSEEPTCSLPRPWLGGLRPSSPSQGQEEAGRTSSAHVSGQAGGSVLDGETEAQTALTGRVQAGPQEPSAHTLTPSPAQELLSLRSPMAKGRGSNERWLGMKE